VKFSNGQIYCSLKKSLANNIFTFFWQVRYRLLEVFPLLDSALYG
jgi:hypothetical protein